jgi:hypothetical protein
MEHIDVERDSDNDSSSESSHGSVGAPEATSDEETDDDEQGASGPQPLAVLAAVAEELTPAIVGPGNVMAALAGMHHTDWSRRLAAARGAADAAARARFDSGSETMIVPPLLEEFDPEHTELQDSGQSIEPPELSDPVSWIPVRNQFNDVDWDSSTINSTTSTATDPFRRISDGPHHGRYTFGYRAPKAPTVTLGVCNPVSNIVDQMNRRGGSGGAGGSSAQPDTLGTIGQLENEVNQLRADQVHAAAEQNMSTDRIKQLSATVEALSAKAKDEKKRSTNKRQQLCRAKAKVESVKQEWKVRNQKLKQEVERNKSGKTALLLRNVELEDKLDAMQKGESNLSHVSTHANGNRYTTKHKQGLVAKLANVNVSGRKLAEIVQTISDGRKGASRSTLNRALKVNEVLQIHRAVETMDSNTRDGAVTSVSLDATSKRIEGKKTSVMGVSIEQTYSEFTTGTIVVHKEKGCLPLMQASGSSALSEVESICKTQKYMDKVMPADYEPGTLAFKVFGALRFVLAAPIVRTDSAANAVKGAVHLICLRKSLIEEAKENGVLDMHVRSALNKAAACAEVKVLELEAVTAQCIIHSLHNAANETPAQLDQYVKTHVLPLMKSVEKLVVADLALYDATFQGLTGFKCQVYVLRKMTGQRQYYLAEADFLEEWLDGRERAWCAMGMRTIGVRFGDDARYTCIAFCIFDKLNAFAAFLAEEKAGELLANKLVQSFINLVNCPYMQNQLNASGIMYINLWGPLLTYFYRETTTIKSAGEKIEEVHRELQLLSSGTELENRLQGGTPLCLSTLTLQSEDDGTQTTRNNWVEITDKVVAGAVNNNQVKSMVQYCVIGASASVRHYYRQFIEGELKSREMSKEVEATLDASQSSPHTMQAEQHFSQLDHAVKAGGANIKLPTASGRVMAGAFGGSVQHGEWLDGKTQNERDAIFANARRKVAVVAAENKENREIAVKNERVRREARANVGRESLASLDTKTKEKQAISDDRPKSKRQFASKVKAMNDKDAVLYMKELMMAVKFTHGKQLYKDAEGVDIKLQDHVLALDGIKIFAYSKGTQTRSRDDLVEAMSTLIEWIGCPNRKIPESERLRQLPRFTQAAPTTVATMAEYQAAATKEPNYIKKRKSEAAAQIARATTKAAKLDAAQMIALKGFA